MISSNNLISKDYILRKYNQLDIFIYYLTRINKYASINNVTKEDIVDAVNTGSAMCSPIRIDVNPSVGFKYDCPVCKKRDLCIG